MMVFICLCCKFLTLATVTVCHTCIVTHLQLCHDQLLFMLICVSDHHLVSVLMCELDHNSAVESQSISAHDEAYILLEISTKEGHHHHHIDVCTNSYHVLQLLPAGVQGHVGTWH